MQLAMRHHRQHVLIGLKPLLLNHRHALHGLSRQSPHRGVGTAPTFKPGLYRQASRARVIRYRVCIHRGPQRFPGKSVRWNVRRNSPHNNDARKQYHKYESF